MTDPHPQSASMTAKHKIRPLKIEEVKALREHADKGPAFDCNCESSADLCTCSTIMMLCDEWLALRAAASPSPSVDREAVAKIIDPDCADALEVERKWCEENGKTFAMWARGFIVRWEKALAKADAILALLNASAPAVPSDERRSDDHA